MKATLASLCYLKNCSPFFLIFMKKLFSSRTLGFLLAAGACLLGTPSRAQVSINKANWNIAFQDEFDDPSTIGPNSTKWSNGYSFGTLDTPVLSQLHYATWDNIHVHDGVADFIVRDISSNPIYHNGTPYNYTTGAITSKFDDVASSGCQANSDPTVGIGNRGFLYGMFEIRCRLPKGNGQFAAFWMYGASIESDVFEFEGNTPNLIKSNQHYPTTPATSCQTGYTKVSPGDLTEDYHVYTLVWTPTAMTYFLDGREIRTDTSPNRHIPGWNNQCNWQRMVLCIDAEVFYPIDPAGLAAGANSPFSVDYVRVYKPVGNNYNDNSYKASTAINTVRCIDPKVPALINPQAPCGSPSGVPTRHLDVDYNQDIYTTSVSGAIVKFPGTLTSYGGGSYPDPATTNAAGNVTCSKVSPNVFYSDAQGHMWTLYNYYGWASACLDWGINDVSNNVVLSSTNLYYRTTSGGLSYFWFDNSNGWHHTSVPQVSNISACQGSIATIDNYVFYKATNNQLYYVQSTPTGWSNPVQIAPANNVGNSIAINSFPNSSGLGSYRIYYIGTDNAVYISYLENGQWVSWGLDWHVTNAASDLVVSGDLLFYKGTDARLWNYYYYEGWRLSPINYDQTTDVQGELVPNSDGGVFFMSSGGCVNGAFANASRFVNPACSSSSNVSNRVAPNPTSAPISHSATKKAAVQVVVYDIFTQKILAKSTIKGPVTRQNLGLTPGFYVLHYLDANGRVVRIEKTVFTE